MTNPRVSAGMLAISLILAAGTAMAQNYPSRVIRIITSGAGTGNDFTARLIAQGVSGPLGQQVIVDNRGGNVLIQAMPVANAPRDGYTLLLHSSAFWLLPYL